MRPPNVAEVEDVSPGVTIEMAVDPPEPDLTDVRADGSIDRRGTSERIRLAGGVIARVSTDVQYDQNGMKMSDYFKPENIPENIKDAVAEDRAERNAPEPQHSPRTLLTPLGQPFAIFRHTEFTQEEDEAIVAGILAGIPLYLIAEKLHTSRGNLSKHVKESKLLSQAFEDREEAMLDHVEYKAKKLVDSGNPAMIMFWLERKGRMRGWGSQDIAQVEGDDNRIVIGEIPEGDLKEADEIQAKATEIGIRLGDDGKAELGNPGGPTVALPTPMEFAQTMTAVEEIDAERAAKERAAAVKNENMRRNSIDVESVETVSPGGDGGASSQRGEPPPTPDAESHGGGWDDEFGGGGMEEQRAPWEEGGGWEPMGF